LTLKVKTGSYIAICLAGLPFLLLGLLFLVAAAFSPQRLIVAAVLLLVGFLLVASGVMGYRRASFLEPESLTGYILKLARARGGKITVELVSATLGIRSDEAHEAVNFMIAKGYAKEEFEGETRIVNVGGVVTKLERKCPYCGSNFPVREHFDKCPSCGASLEMK
jgi:hypothetical protein